ncbi:MFS transporter [Kaistia sp. 32K]|uniref:MFS transporter n=1 Tax=Kaistia sp. 32K TaxID=2795690 RepID=UPI0019167214|nr:MFS transporter [Kaistia sp. 32K]BCP53992.1 MFS transporter [Kaistia sp. 32K]
MHAPLRRRDDRWAVLTAVSITFSLTILNVTIVNVAMADIRQALGATMESLQWMTTVYLMIFASLLVAGGFIADRLGPALLFMIGTAVFVAASLVGGLAESIGWLMIGRIGQGIGAALAVPTSLTLIKQSFPHGPEQARAISLWIGCSSLSLAVGMYLGGALVEWLGWQSIFFLNLPVGLAALLLGRALWRDQLAGPRDRISELRQLDVPGLVLSIVALATLTWTCIELGAGLASRTFLVSLGAFLAAATAFLLVERRSANPLMPLTLIRQSDVWRGCLSGILVSFCFYGLLFFLGVFFQFQLGYSPSQTGLAFLPMTGTTVFGNMIGGQLTVTQGPHRTISIGAAMGLSGTLASIPGLSEGVAIYACLALIGLGVAIAVPAMTFLVVRRTGSGMASLVSGLLNTTRQIGAVLGIGLFGALANLYQGHLDDAFPIVLGMSGLAFAVCLIINAEPLAKIRIR